MAIPRSKGTENFIKMGWGGFREMKSAKINTVNN